MADEFEFPWRSLFVRLGGRLWAWGRGKSRFANSPAAGVGSLSLSHSLSLSQRSAGSLFGTLEFPPGLLGGGNSHLGIKEG